MAATRRSSRLLWTSCPSRAKNGPRLISESGWIGSRARYGFTSGFPGTERRFLKGRNEADPDSLFRSRVGLRGRRRVLGPLPLQTEGGGFGSRPLPCCDNTERAEAKTGACQRPSGGQ